MGVPSLGCPCAVCHSNDPRDIRTRPSVLLSRGGLHVVIDTTPDFRFQCLRAGVNRLDAVIYTHGHADHILGFDDLRAYSMRQKAPVPIYASAETLEILRRAFAYVFDGVPAVSTIPEVVVHTIAGPLELLGAQIVPVPAEHGPIRVLGFRIGRAAYLTDFSAVPDPSKQLLQGLDDFILDALRDTPHPMHQTVEQALALVAEVKPRRAWFTHIAHDLPHAATNQRLRTQGFPHVQLSYDGLSFEVAL